MLDPASTAQAPSTRQAQLPPCNHRPEPYIGPSRDEVLALRQQYLPPGYITYYREPLLLVEGSMQYVWDETGRRYLDAFAGIVTISVGHCHPYVVERVRAQLGKLQHTTTIYLHPTVGQFAQRLAEHMPADGGLQVTFFTNSGSEANEVAVLAAREFTGNHEVISLRNSYHGATQGTMALTAHGTWKYPSNPTVNVKHGTPGYCYRCPLGLTYPTCEIRCATELEERIKYETNGQVAAFIAEPIQGVGGAVVPPPEYFQIVFDIVRRHGGLCIADEVQTGFGRTGTQFWGFENWGVTPDLVTMAKGIGNGTALGACTMRREVAESLRKRVHFNTFAGNPVQMTQGLATLEVIDRDEIQKNALQVGAHLRNRLIKLQERQPLVGDVRGMGLMLGVELVRNRDSKEPANTEAAEVLELCRQRGLLIGRGGLYGNVLRIKPPMCVTTDDADFIADCLEEVLPLAAALLKK